jgi:hypothetical protein
MACIVGRILKDKGYKLSNKGRLMEFTDSSKIPAWGTEDAKLAVEKGIMPCIGEFNPDLVLKRADIAVILKNLNDIH